MPRFQTVVRRARFVYSPYTASEIQGFAQVLADSIRSRIRSGQNIYDQAAAPLKPGLPGRRGYPDYKSARTSTKCFQAARLVTPYQCNSDSTASLCVLLNSVIAALLMILTP